MAFYYRISLCNLNVSTKLYVPSLSPRLLCFQRVSELEGLSKQLQARLSGSIEDNIENHRVPPASTESGNIHTSMVSNHRVPPASTESGNIHTSMVSNHWVPPTSKESGNIHTFMVCSTYYVVRLVWLWLNLIYGNCGLWDV